MGAALSHTAFRRVFAGSLASNIGTWMQNVSLLALAWNLTHDSTYMGLITFAQLGPMLVLSPVGGAIADRVDRRVFMVTISAIQAGLSLLLAQVAMSADPDRTAILAIVFGIGIGAALMGPSMGATLPALVGIPDLQGAVALNSAAMNASRVVGPILAGVTDQLGGAPLSFRINALTYGFVILALVTVSADFSPKGRRGESPLRQLVGGFREARADRVIGGVLLTIAVFSLFSLVFIYQLPRIAEEQLGLGDTGYTLLFATFGLGALLGALSMGSVFAEQNRPQMVRRGLWVFAVALAAFAVAGVPAVAFPAVFLAGGSYFVIVTALVTILQLRVRNEVRGRVMGLWMMAWAGLVPVGGLLGGAAIDSVGLAPVLLLGATVAAALAVAVTVALRNSDAASPGDPGPAADPRPQSSSA